MIRASLLGEQGRVDEAAQQLIAVQANPGEAVVLVHCSFSDGWTAVTRDRSLSAHYELTVAVTQHGPWILSEPYPYGQAEAANA